MEKAQRPFDKRRMVNMNRFISSCLLYLCLFISLSCGSSSKSVQHSSTDNIRRLQQTEQTQNYDLQNNNRNPIHIITLTNTTNTTNATSNPDNFYCGSSVDSAMALCRPCPTGTLDECMKYSHEFACIKGVDSCAHANHSANNPAVPSPTPPTTHAPTKKYIPAPPDDEESEIEKEATKIGWLFLYIVIIFAFIWVVISYREAIFYFARNVSIV